MFGSILVAIDPANHDRAKSLVAQARKLCCPDGTIRLLHVLRGPADGKLRASAMAGLLALLAETDERILPVLREGAVAPQIKAMAEEDEVELVMLASRLPGMTEFFRDTTATKVTRHSTISVLVARSPTPERTPQDV